MGDSEATAALQDEALAAVAAGVLVVSAAGVVLLANAGAAALCGRPVAALRGMLADVLARWVGVGPDAPSPRPVDERSPVALALWEELRAELAEDELRELLAVLRRQAATIFGEMRGRLAAGDLHAIGALAHKLCGSAGNLGAQGLVQELQALEAVCRSPGEGRALGEADVAALERSFAAADAFFRAQLPES